MSITIKATKREQMGKNACNRIRRQGRVPAVIYGQGVDSLPLIVDKKDLLAILKTETGENTLFKIGFDSELVDAMIKDLQLDPATDELLHADLIRISMDKAIRVSVGILLKGEPVGVKAEGGFVDFITRQVEVECLPRDIPESLEVDISQLHLHQSAKVGDLKPPQGVKILEDANQVLVLIDLPKEEAAKEAVPVEGEAAEEKAEPEVIKKERAEKEPAEKPEKPEKSERKKE